MAREIRQINLSREDICYSKWRTLQCFSKTAQKPPEAATGDNAPATVKFYLSKYRDAIRQIDPNHLVLRPRKMRSGQRFRYLALPPEETRAINAAYHQRIHRDQSSLIPLEPEAIIHKASGALSQRALHRKKAWD